ncbi:hypothetical protein ACLKA7_002559 [Drosophila subpalustris]
MGDDIPSPHNNTLYCPRSADRSTDDLLVMLSKQNKIETDAWRVISRKEEGGGALLVLGIDEMARDDIVSRGHQLFFRYRKIPVSGLKKATDKDGMRPVPAPSEKMDMEQQLELSDELEGADVTLTPRYDEGIVWPPSSCELEPLF